MASKKTLEERILEADAKGSSLLADANAAQERGATKTAERLYAQGQKWLDKYNELTGNA